MQSYSLEDATGVYVATGLDIRNEDTSSTSHPKEWLVNWFRGTESDSGVHINGKTALSYAPIWYGVNKIAGNLGTLPMVVHEQVDDRTTRKARNHFAYRLMKTRPNALMTAGVFRETLTQHALLWGNGRGAILRNNAMRPDEIVPLLPDRTVTALIDGEKWHVTELSQGDRQQFDPGVTENKIAIPDEDVLHIPGLGYDGLSGYSVIEMAQNSWGGGLAGEKHINRHFKNEARPGIMLEAPAGVFRDEKDAQLFLDNFNQYHQGVDKAGRAGLLREGIKANTLSMSGRDAQWIEQRLFARQEAALWLLLEQILGDDSSVSYNSLEAKNTAFVVNCLMRWVTKWEQEANEKLLTDTQKRNETHFFKINVSALLRGTTKERYDAYAVGIQHRFISPNEAREKEDWNPYDGGDEFENPAISPGTPGGDVSDMVDRRVRGLIGVEVKRVTSAAGRPGNYVAWLDGFYGKWSKTITGAIGDSGLSAYHCSESKRLLLEACDRATAETLESVIVDLTSDWLETRTADLAQAIRDNQ